MATRVVNQGRFDTLSSQLSNTGSTVARRTAPDLATPSSSAVNVTGTATPAQVAGGRITSTSAAAVTLTLPTAANLIAHMNLKKGNYFDLTIDNTEGANTVTVALGAGITQAVIVPNGGAGALTLAASATLGIAVFRFIVAEDELGIIISRLF